MDGLYSDEEEQRRWWIAWKLSADDRDLVGGQWQYQSSGEETMESERLTGEVQYETELVAVCNLKLGDGFMTQDGHYGLRLKDPELPNQLYEALIVDGGDGLGYLKGAELVYPTAAKIVFKPVG